MFDKLDSLEGRFVEIEDSLMQSSISGEEFVKLNKERAEIEPVVTVYRKYKATLADLKNAKEMLLLDDQEMKELAKEEIEPLTNQIEEFKKELTILLLPSDPNDQKNIILEIRAGTGGEEAGIFCGDLLRMYTRYAERQNWEVSFLSSTESPKGGYKEIILSIEGKRVYSRLKFESGVHRVQRIPLTESQGRIHTSACTVAVLPEADDVEIEIKPQDLRIDTYRASGSGGQHVNTTDSAVRITHVPTGVVSECQDERSQHKNKDKAMKMLRTRLFDKLQEEQRKEISEDRKLQVGSGDRSERIRTYNFPQGRMTDHRINLTLYRLTEIMDGDIDEILENLGTHNTAELLRQQEK